MTALRPGDATFAKSFTRISYSECGSFSQTLRFSAGKGRKRDEPDAGLEPQPQA